MADSKSPYSDDKYYNQDVKEVLSKFSVDTKGGLNDAQVAESRAKYGRNEIPPGEKTSLLEMIMDQFKDLLVLILLGAACVSIVLALLEDPEDRLAAFVEPAVIFIILILNATVGVLQESNAENAIEKLKESEAREAKVVRNGSTLSIAATDLVPGDIVIVDVGDKVPADCRVINIFGAALNIDQSMLTGESEPVHKTVDRIKLDNAVNQDKTNMLFSGTLCNSGRASAVVVFTGAWSQMGAIAENLKKKEGEDEDKTPLQHKLDEFGEQLSKVIAVICIVVWLINIGHFTDPVFGSWLKGAIYYFKIAVALAVAAIPEGLPAVVTTCLALGAMKMARKNAIVRHLPSVETLGCTTVICSDKTGTLTTNKMTVQKIVSVQGVQAGRVTFGRYNVGGNDFSPFGSITDENSGKVLGAPALEDASLALIGKVSALCNDSTIVYKEAEKEKAAVFDKTGAPTEAALMVLAEKIGVTNAGKQAEIQASQDNAFRASAASAFWNGVFGREHFLEFERGRKTMSVSGTEGKTKILYCKGAPEEVLSRCKYVVDKSGKTTAMTKDMAAQIEEAFVGLAKQGLRCIALASRENPDPKADYTSIAAFRAIESDMTFIGMVGMLDPPRDSVPDAIAKCHTAGIRVIVITGDNQITAESICRRIGLFGASENLKGKSFTGLEFEMMSEEGRRQAAATANLFSRVEPRHKLELVNLLRDQGQIVAMTGDGVNDAPALSKAHIGIAMGTGTDVARQASSMVLQDDNFATIVMAVEEGRTIYANTKQFIRYLISSNIGEVACIFITAISGMPEALIPVQLLWVNLVTDGLPATALGFNPADKDIMERPPRSKDEGIISKWMFFRYCVIGVYVGIGTVGGFVWWFLYSSTGPQISMEQLLNFHQCNAGEGIFANFAPGCAIFHDARPSTVSLSVLVTIEMFNAMNALSENQSLLVVGPLTNIWVVLACTLSVLLHLVILYVPFFANIFHAAPLNQEEWIWTIILSLPVIFLDEALKFLARLSAEAPKPKSD